jgi:hypothetical protein
LHRNHEHRWVALVAVARVVGLVLGGLDVDALRRARRAAAKARHAARRAVGALRETVDAAEALRVFDLLFRVFNRVDVLLGLRPESVLEEAAHRKPEAFGDLGEIHVRAS